MLLQLMDKIEVNDEFVKLPDFCICCEVEVINKIIERDKLNIPRSITFEYLCGAVLTSTNHYVKQVPTTGHVVKIKHGCKNAILSAFYNLKREDLNDHKINILKAV